MTNDKIRFIKMENALSIRFIRPIRNNSLHWIDKDETVFLELKMSGNNLRGFLIFFFSPDIVECYCIFRFYLSLENKYQQQPKKKHTKETTKAL